MDTKVCNLCAFVTALFSPNGCLLNNFDTLHYWVHLYGWSTIYFFCPPIPSLFWRVFLVLTFLLSFFLFELTRHTSPGVIELEKFNLAYDEKGVCRTCQTPKYIRSKHCKETDKCYYRFDHFCPWTKTPIARANLRWFYLFLLFQFCHLGAGLPLLYKSISNDSIELYGINLSGWYSLICFLWNCFLEIGVGGLLMTHTWKISKNLTTNELSNHQRYKHFSLVPYQNPYDKGLIENWIMLFTAYVTENRVASHV